MTFITNNHKQTGKDLEGQGGSPDDGLRQIVDELIKEDEEIERHNNTVAAYDKDEDKRTAEDWKLMYQDVKSAFDDLVQSDIEHTRLRQQVASWTIDYTQAMEEIMSRFVVYEIMVNVMRGSQNKDVLQTVEMLSTVWSSPQPVTIIRPPDLWLELANQVMEDLDDLPF